MSQHKPKQTFQNNASNSSYNISTTKDVHVNLEKSPLSHLSSRNRKQLRSQKLQNFSQKCSGCEKKKNNQKPYGLWSVQNIYDRYFDFEKKQQTNQTPHVLWSEPNIYYLCSNCDRRQIVPQTKALKDYRLGKLIGTGKFSKVFLAKDKLNNSLVAIKVMDKSYIKHEKLEHQVNREISIQRKLKHPHIVQLFTNFNDDDHIYLVLEFVAGGEVYNHLRNSPLNRFSNCRAAKYMYQVADAVQYCHRRNVIHRDIKPENLILSLDDNIKLSDFGWSVRSSILKRNTLCGTFDYIAPEMINKEYYDELIDNWCMGVLCYEFLVGVPPFRSEDNNETMRKIIDLDVEYPKYMCHRARDLISKLLQKNPKNRLSLSGIKRHNWIVSKMQFDEEEIIS